VDVLDGRDETDPASAEERESAVEHGHVEVESDGFIDDVGALFDRGMAEMHQNIRKREGVEREVTGPVAGVAADGDRKPCFTEGGGYPRCLPGKPGGELEGDRPYPAFTEPYDEIRDRYR